MGDPEGSSKRLRNVGTCTLFHLASSSRKLEFLFGWDLLLLWISDPAHVWQWLSNAALHREGVLSLSSPAVVLSDSSVLVSCVIIGGTASDVR
jgi:hypothetical protein